eukprot:4756148-Prorocentrum_lima.AAC.1
MTSSLVGSEMCIRDSSVEKQEKNMVHAPALRLKELHDKRPRSDTDYAVSYTHLTLPTICSV